MTQLRGSQNYIWSLVDVLGQGATGAVYKGRHKTTGEMYAVKTFNQMSHMRPLDVQVREFDVLQRLNHENIVRLLGIEEETSSTGKVLVMELCSGGSLFHILEEPENIFGMEEQEYLLVLHDVSAALNHLRENGIVHRDIKPGNIMKYTNDSGRSVYKLIDFGAARQLQEEEQFMSLYGTEEYLHPDMYERAVLRRPMSKQFGASVDIWSLGVTFYHVATGSLPFRPYGGRKNKETMHNITTKKESGVISGVQHTLDGPIEWSRELPDTCRLSQGARNLITPLLAGLTECDPKAMWSYEEFFAEVEKVLSKKLIYVLDLSHCEMLHIYMDVTDTYAALQDVVAVQTDIHARHQLLLYENLPFSSLVELTQPIGSYPETSISNPILLYYNDATASPQPPSFSIPDFPPITQQVTLDADPTTAKVSCGIMCLLRRHICQYINLQQFISRANHSFHLVLSRDVERLLDFVRQFEQLVESSGSRVASFVKHSRLHSQLLNNAIPGGIPQIETEQFETSLGSLQTNFHEIENVLKEKRHYVEAYFEKVVLKKELVGKNRVLPACQDSDRCVAKLDVLIDQGLQTIAAFRRNKSLKRLNHNEEQIHKFDKIKLQENSTKACYIFTNHCQPNLKKTFHKFVKWYSWASRAREKVRVLESQLGQLTDKHKNLCAHLQQAESQTFAQVDNKMKRMVNNPISTASPLINDSNGSSNIHMSHLYKQLATRLGELKSESAAVRMAVDENTKLIKDLDVQQSPQSMLSSRGPDSAFMEPMS